MHNYKKIIPMKKLIFPYIELYFSSEIIHKSFNELTNRVDSFDDRTNLIRRISDITNKPLKGLSTDDLAMLLRQRVGGALTLAIALMIVAEELMICADTECGDLLKLTLEYSWNDWLETEVYGIDPYGLIAQVESVVSGVKDIGQILDDLCQKLNQN